MDMGREAKGIMKYQAMRKRVAIIIQVIFLILCNVVILDACTDFKPSSSHFGHGQYRCFYQNVQTKKVFDAKAGDQQKAMREAKEACLKGENLPAVHCQFSDCLFR